MGRVIEFLILIFCIATACAIVVWAARSDKNNHKK